MRLPKGNFKRVGTITLAMAILGLCLASTASARRLIFWSNSIANKISYAPVIEGGKGADLPIDPSYVDDPYGTAIDSAAGKVYWLNKGNGGSIGFANLDGSGVGLLNTSGASFAEPSGLAIDPAAGKIYWGNSESGNGSIGFANLNSSGGGLIKPAGATTEPTALALDPANSRIYWTNNATNTISYAALDGSNAHDVDTYGAPVDGPDGIAIVARTGRIYWANRKGNSIGYAGLSGGAGGAANLNQFISKPIGLTTDGEAVYWASEGFEKVEAGNFAACCAVPLETAGATQSGVAFPVILEGPRVSEILKVEGSHTPGATLTCSTLNWTGDAIESFLYRAPQNISYQWLRNKIPIPGATGTTIVASKVGKYVCQVTATNFAASNVAQNPNEFAVNAKVGFKKVTFNRKKGTATLRVAVTGAGRLDLYGKGVANVSRKRVTGTARLVVRSSGAARIKLKNTGKAKVKATVSYTPEGGKAIKRRETVVLKKGLR
jgi:DNA-binding beta-propeller fold protein YncE